MTVLKLCRLSWCNASFARLCQRQLSYCDTAVTVHLGWQHLRRSTCSCEIFQVQSLGESARGKYPYYIVVYRPYSKPQTFRTRYVKQMFLGSWISDSWATCFHACHHVCCSIWMVEIRAVRPRCILTHAQKIAPFGGTPGRFPPNILSVTPPSFLTYRHNLSFVIRVQVWGVRRLVAWHSRRTSVFGRRTFPVLRSTQLMGDQLCG